MRFRAKRLSRFHNLDLALPPLVAIIDHSRPYLVDINLHIVIINETSYTMRNSLVTERDWYEYNCMTCFLLILSLFLSFAFLLYSICFNFFAFVSILLFCVDYFRNSKLCMYVARDMHWRFEDPIASLIATGTRPEWSASRRVILLASTFFVVISSSFSSSSISFDH